MTAVYFTKGQEPAVIDRPYSTRDQKFNRKPKVNWRPRPAALICPTFAELMFVSGTAKTA